MAYFGSRDVAAIAFGSSLWGVLNGYFSPMFFRITGLPVLCDIIGFAVLSVIIWWVRKFGAATIVGFVATPVVFILNPGQFTFLGFTAASFVFDLLTGAVGYDRVFRKGVNSFAFLVLVSVVSAAVAGYIIGALFMAGPALLKWGGALGWAGLHVIGGVVGGFIGIALVLALEKRRISVYSKSHAKL